MRDQQCVSFLQWALPQLQMRWPGFRKVRRQVCKRIDRRIRELGLTDVGDYRSWLEEHSDEWGQLDTMCRITISRFCRDRAVFDILASQVLPSLADAAHRGGGDELRIWSIGCASGEEPYSLALTWHCEIQSRFPEMSADIVATDVDPHMLRRASAGRYGFGGLRELPAQWCDRAFTRDGDSWRLEPEFRRSVRFLKQDIRKEKPEGQFDLVLCRNLVFTYFDEDQQAGILRRIVDVMHDGAALVLGAHERLPDDASELSAWIEKRPIWRKLRK